MMNKLAKFLQKFAMDYVIKYLKNNPKEILSASSKSRKAIEYILNK